MNNVFELQLLNKIEKI